MRRTSAPHSTNLGIGEWTGPNRWTLLLSVDCRGNVTRAHATHSRLDVDPDLWPSFDLDLEPFGDLAAQLGFACIEAAAQGFQQPLPGMRLER